MFASDPPLHEMDPIGRFSDRAADYDRYRPDYPASSIDAILAGLDEPARLVVADIGAGTGIASRQLADRGPRVLAVEPNAAMRGTAPPHPRISWRDGTAEATGLEAASVHLVVSAQAFHWFRPREAVAEFRRILRPDGRLALIWNDRDARDPLTRGFVEAIHAVQGEHPAERRPFDPAVIDEHGWFAPAVLMTFQHRQVLDRAGLIGRAASASYIPREGAGFAALERRLTALFDRHRDADSRVPMHYVTKLYLAEPR